MSKVISCAALLLAALFLNPAVANNQAAKAALAQGDHAAVVRIYDQQQPEAAVDHYRLSIAHARLGAWPESQFRLGKALVMDPSGRFANPDRLAALKAEILVSLSMVNPAPALEAAALPATSETPTVATIEPAVSPSVTVTVSPAAPQPVTASVASLSAQPQVFATTEAGSNSGWYVALGGLFSLLILAFMAWNIKSINRAAASIKQENEVARYKSYKDLVDIKNAIADLKEEQTPTLLVAHIDRFLNHAQRHTREESDSAPYLVKLREARSLMMDDITRTELSKGNSMLKGIAEADRAWIEDSLASQPASSLMISADPQAVQNAFQTGLDLKMLEAK